MNSKILASVMVIALVGALAGAGTFAYFTDTEKVTGNTFTSGNLDVSIPEPGNPQEFPVSFTNMKPGEWTEKKTLELQNSGSLTEVIDRIQVSALSEKDRKSTLEDSVSQEHVWGDGLKELNDPLEVKVNYNGDMAVFHAWAPEDYGAVGNDLMTFAFDKDADGEADSQIQWNKDGNKEWQYDEVVSGSWEGDWSELPSEFIAGRDSKHFWLKVPVDYLGGYDSEYKFGVDSNGQGSGKGQTFYSTNPWNLWSTEENPSDYTTSEYYVPMSTKSATNMGPNAFAKKVNVKVYHNGEIRSGNLWDFYTNGDDFNMIQDGNEITLNPGDSGWYKFKFQLDPSAGNSYQGDGVEATFEVEAVQEGQE